mgnify:CR=1 FL=1
MSQTDAQRRFIDERLAQEVAHLALPPWLAEIEALLGSPDPYLLRRDGRRLLELCKAQRAALGSVFRHKRCPINCPHRVANRLWKGK